MSAAPSASQATVRRSAAAPASRTVSPTAPAPQRAARPASNAVRFADAEPEIRVNLGDVTIERPKLDADVFKPSLMSRLFGLFAK